MLPMIATPYSIMHIYDKTGKRITTRQRSVVEEKTRFFSPPEEQEPPEPQPFLYPARTCVDYLNN